VHLARVLLDLTRSLALKPSQHAMMKNRGFTLVELVVVILLLAILAFTVIPRFSRGTIGLGGKVDQLASDLRYVQSLSMTRGERHCLNVVSSSSYVIRNNNCTDAVIHPATGSSNPITVSDVSITATNLSVTDKIEFDGKGRPTTFTPSSCDTVISVIGDGETRTVSLCPETGRVAVQ